MHSLDFPKDSNKQVMEVLHFFFRLDSLAFMILSKTFPFLLLGISYVI